MSPRALPPCASAARRSSTSLLAQFREFDRWLREAALVRVLARGHELVAPRRALERILVGELPLRVVRVRGLAHRRAEDLAVAEHRVRYLPADLRVLRVGICVRLLFVQHDNAIHRFLSVAGGGRLSRPTEGGDMAGEIVHFEVMVKDGDAAQAFWGGVFGWQFGPPMSPEMDYRMAQIDATSGAAIGAGGEVKTHPNVHLATEEMHACCARVRELGVSAEEKAAVPGHGWCAACKDPEGVQFNLWQGDASAA